MSDDSQRPIIVKKVKKGGHGGHHGGAWKIAYADFVTAMMAFFLLMWLLGSTTKAQRDGISEYFKTPLKVALSGGTGAGDATSLIKGGGEDITRKTGQVKRGSEPQQDNKAQKTNKPVQVAAEQVEKEKLKNLKSKLEKMIDMNPLLKQFKNQLMLDITNEGLRIQIVDDKNRPMFDSGKADLKPYTRVILREIAKVLNEVPNRISLSGHTDATPFGAPGSNYTNWELSADRANASRRELINAGLQPEKMLRVVGLSDAVPFDPANKFNPINRRISIIVLNKHTEEAITKSSGKGGNGNGDAMEVGNPPAGGAAPAATAEVAQHQ